jgi:nucleoside-diphosphate-sugar epimerase
MSILLTGATGYIGTSVLPRLIDAGHSVTVLVRDAAKSAAVEAAGARALVGDVTDSELVTRAAAESDGVIHLASTKDADPVFIDAALRGLGDTGKALVHTGGLWTYGSGDDLTEDSPAAPPAITAWRGANEARVLSAGGVRGIVVVPSIVYGKGTGLARLLVDAPRETEGEPAIRLIGDGSQHWGTVHVDDLAELYVLVFELGSRGESYIGASGANPTVRELGEAVASAHGVTGGVRAEAVEETRSRLGEALADALLLDQQARGTKARVQLGWEPNRPSLVAELSSGSYAPASVGAAE